VRKPGRDVSTDLPGAFTVLYTHIPVLTLSAMTTGTPDDRLSSSKANYQTQHPTSPTLGLEGSNPPPPPYTNYQGPSQYVVAAVIPEPREPAERRFIKAFLVAVSIWVLAGIFVSSSVWRCLG
jgi:hypothetical protein